METWFVSLKFEMPESPSQPPLVLTGSLKLKTRKQEPNIKAKGFALHI